MDFSIIICTYNPDRILLQRVISSCTGQQTKATREILLVDNNSSPEVPAPGPGVTLVRENRQGLAYARIAGLRASCGNTIVFVDDDNVIAPDYVDKLQDVIRMYPEVGVWGPGEIIPEFTGNGPAWLKRNFSAYFQAKNIGRLQYGRERSWPDYYPSGSGISMRREVLSLYADAFERGAVTMTGRKGRSLCSGEDAQIVWLAVKNGYAAGSAPDLRLVHVISREKQSLRYLRRLQHNIARSYYSALTEIFPEQRNIIRPLSIPGYVRLALRVLLRTGFRPALFVRTCIVEFAWFKGLNSYLRES